MKKPGLSVGFESLYKSLDEDYEYKYRQYPLEIRRAWAKDGCRCPY